MMTASEFAMVYDTILSIPGMEDTVKIDLRMTRKNVLILSSVIDRGLGVKGSEKESGILANVPREVLDELRKIADECLEKATLTELNEKLKSLSVSKAGESKT